jgi:hypothetical protein
MARDFFPTGQISLSSSALQQADEVSFAADNGLSLKATLANPNGTPVAGMRKCEVSFKLRVDNNGPEFSMINAVNQAAPMDLGFKFPGGYSISVKAVAASATTGQTLGSECILDCKAMGHVTDSVGF